MTAILSNGIWGKVDDGLGAHMVYENNKLIENHYCGHQFHCYEIMYTLHDLNICSEMKNSYTFILSDNYK